MKLLHVLVLSLTVAFVPACGSVPSPQTFNQRLAVGYVSVSAVRDTASTLLTSKKISVNDAQNVLEQTDNMRTGLDIARDMFRAGNNLSAENKLTNINAALRALQSYLGSKQ